MISNTSLRRRQNKLVGLSAALLILGFSVSALAELTVYTDRATKAFAKAAATFQAETGQTVKFLRTEDDKEPDYTYILKRLETEASATKADIVLVKDLIYFSELKQKGLMQPISMAAATQKVSPMMRDPEGYWTAVSYRVRTVVYSPSKLTDQERQDIKSYVSLADPKWQGRLCVRTSKHPYNEALVGDLLANLGESRTATVLAGWVNNFAKEPLRGDVAVIKEIANGGCDVGIVNHYYYAQELSKDPNLKVLVEVAMADNNGGFGVHSNGTSVGISKYSTQTALANKFIEILLRDDVQTEFSQTFFDYPAVTQVAPMDLLKGFGAYTLGTTTWDEVGRNVPQARQIIEKAGYK